MEFDRYKFVVQCVIGEQRGQDVKMSCRCFWDSDTDNYAQDVFTNVSGIMQGYILRGINSLKMRESLLFV